MKKILLLFCLILILSGCTKEIEVKEAKAIPEFTSIHFREDNTNTLELNLNQFIGEDYYVNYILPLSMNETRTQLNNTKLDGYIYIRHYQGDQILASSFDKSSTIHVDVEMVENKENEIKMNFDVYFKDKSTVLNYDGFIIVSLTISDTYVEAFIIDTYFNNRKKS